MIKKYKILIGIGILLFILLISWFLGTELYDKKVVSETNKWLSDQREYLETFPGYVKKAPKNIFFDERSAEEASISKKDFLGILEKQDKNNFLLDAREDFEWDEGYFEGSLHMRMIDILIGGWQDIPRDKRVYVICWTGARGGEIANFLREKNILAYYYDGGIDELGSVDTWVENTEQIDKHSAPNYRKLFRANELSIEIDKGVFVVDTRSTEDFMKSQIKDSINISILKTPSDQIEEVLSNITGDRVIVVCNSLVSCFDAKASAVEIEKSNKVILGFFKSIE
ncbi:hypothetical protein C0584_03685 [Candidatus Parcubacteria bacterium]|nr:MAG: hypothetical protein C0584_03685 [Candidatus Parcubacteria bacterium]